MDYLQICDQIITKFDTVAVELAKKYGALPVIGIGHSLGAVLQTLITSLFPETPRAVNVLISFNSKSATAAIPMFQELVVPIAKQLSNLAEEADKADTLISSSSGTNDEKGLLSKLNLQAQRSLPSFIARMQRIRKSSRFLFESYAQSPLSPALIEQEILPSIDDAIEIFDQIPPLLKQISDGQTEFIPQYLDTKEVCRRMYRARRTMLVKFDNDSIDESEQIQTVLKEANTIMRMKRPMIEMEVTLKNLPGTHITPLVPTILPTPIKRLLPKVSNEVARAEEVIQAQQLVEEVLSFLSSGGRATSPLP